MGSNPKRLLKASSKKAALRRGKTAPPDQPGLDVTCLSSFVAQPAVRRRIYSEARSLLDDAKSDASAASEDEVKAPNSPGGLFHKAAASVRLSVRKASLSGFAMAQIAGASAGAEAVYSRPTTPVSAGEKEEGHDEDSHADEVDDQNAKLREKFLKTLDEVRAILDSLDLSETVEEVSHVLDCVRELEAMMDSQFGTDSQENLQMKDIEQQVRSALERAAQKIPTAVDAISRARSPNSSQQASTALQNIEGFREQSLLLSAAPAPKKHKNKGKKRPERRFSREELRQKLRSNGFEGWIQLPPPQGQRESPVRPPDGAPRSRESWLKWWSLDDGVVDRRENFFETLPPHKLTLPEMELRDAIIDFLEQRKGKSEMPTWDEIRVQPTVLLCTKKLLPHYVSLEEWLHRRQRLSKHEVISWPPPPPVWRLEPVERWKKDPPSEPPMPAVGQFQRRDSTQRRGSSVFGVNFEVTDHGEIFGALAKDDEALCELPWPCSSVVPEQKSFGWIKGCSAKGSLPSVASAHRNMTVEDVMAWRLSHRVRQRKVEPVLQSMWQTMSRQRVPKTCRCEHCSGTLQYQITLASE